MSEKRRRGKRLDKATINNLGPEYVAQLFEVWSQYDDRVVWLLHNDGDPEEIEENRDKACIYYECYLDLLISLKTRESI